jgi:hypothetical protein
MLEKRIYARKAQLVIINAGILQTLYMECSIGDALMKIRGRSSIKLSNVSPANNIKTKVM